MRPVVSTGFCVGLFSHPKRRFSSLLKTRAKGVVDGSISLFGGAGGAGEGWVPRGAAPLSGL